MEQNKNIAEFYEPLYREIYENNKKLEKELKEKDLEIERLKSSLDRIKNNKLWKLSKPMRNCIHRLENLRNRVSSTDNVDENQDYAQRFGTGSFPDAGDRCIQQEQKFDNNVLFSILVPLYNTPKKFLEEMIDSVISQTYQNWELCLTDGSDEKHSYVGDYCRESAAADNRILYLKLEENLGISENTNAAIKMAHGEYIVLFDHDDILHPSVLYEYVKVINECGADFIYCDEATFQNGNIDDMITLHFKPDYAPDNLRAVNYICHLSAFSAELLKKTGPFRSEFDGSQDHDMILRLTSAASKICHVSRILYYWRAHSESVCADINAKTYAINAAREAVRSFLENCGYRDCVIMSTKAFPTIFEISYQIPQKSLISIIIPNKDHLIDLRRCVDSILNRSTYSNYEIIIVENNSETDEIKEYYKILEMHPQIKVINYGKSEFNYSEINNYAAGQAKGEYLLFLNNDTEIITNDWIEKMLMYAQRDDVGAVGARLLFPNNTIQHSGVIIGLGPSKTAGHIHYRMPSEFLGYMGRLCYAQNFSAVTAACMMISKELFLKINGFDNEFAVSFNDIDLCLRVRRLDKLIVFTPFAELYHYESLSRGLDTEEENSARFDREIELFRSRWKKELDSGDPYYNTNLSLESSDCRIAKR